MAKKRFVPDPRMQPQEVLVIAAGRIGGTYADHFHKLSKTGKTGYYLDRDPTPEEKAQMLADIRRHRESLVHELTGLAEAERLLRKDEDLVKNPKPVGRIKNDAHYVVQRLLFAMHIYGGAKIETRGPSGCLFDVIRRLEPETYKKLSEGAAPGDLLEVSEAL